MLVPSTTAASHRMQTESATPRPGLLRFATLSWALFLLTPALAGCPERPLEPRAPTPGVFHFTVQTFNVEFGDSSDPVTVAAVGEADADIVCLQEVTPAWQAVLMARYAQRYPHMVFHVRGPTSTAGLAVLSRYPIDDQGVQPAPNGWHPAWHLHVETPGGSVQLLHVHLRAPLNGRSGALESYLKVEDDHRLEIDQFAQVLEENRPTLVLGDFNEEADGAALRFLEERGFTNALPLFHPGQGTWRYRSVADQFDRALDHILYGAGLAPLDAWVRRRGHSDHLPVVGHFELSSN